MTNRNVTSLQNCKRCGSDLYDPESQARGVGPTCGANIAAAADVMGPMDLVEAETLLSSVRPVDWPLEARTRLTAMLSHNIVTKTGRKALLTDIIWASGWGKQVGVLAKLTKALGFVGVWGMLFRGASPNKKAKVWMEDGMLCLKAPKNRGGRDAFRSIRARYTNKAWRTPVKNIEKFRAIVCAYWPLANIDAALADAWVSVVTGDAAEIANELAKEAKAGDLCSGAVLRDLALEAGILDESDPEPAKIIILREGVASRWLNPSRAPRRESANFRKGSGVVALDFHFDREVNEAAKSLGRNLWSYRGGFGWSVAASALDAFVAKVTALGYKVDSRLSYYTPARPGTLAEDWTPAGLNTSLVAYRAEMDKLTHAENHLPADWTPPGLTTDLDEYRSSLG